jgi:Helix-turn-helix
MMTIEDYRVKLGWTKARLAREAGIDPGTLADAIAGRRIYKATAGKIANAPSNALGQEITYKDIAGLNLAD